MFENVRLDMLTNAQIRAIGLLFESSEDEVARRLKVRRETLEEWKQDPEFIRAIGERLKGNRQAAVRILSRLYLDACRELEKLVQSDDDKNKPKILIEVLKASGLFKELGLDEGDFVGNLLGRLADESEEAESGEEA
jgi:hypothetical protein